MEPRSTEANAGTRRERNRRGEGGQLREDIVTGALELLDETGDSQAITLRAVARAVGISAPSIYPHFRDRQAILLAAVQQAFGELHQYLRNELERAGPDVVDRLLAMCDAYLRFARERPQRYLIMFGGVWNASQAIADSVVALGEVIALGRLSLDELASCLEACVAAGRSDSTDPATDATMLWVALHGMAHQRIVTATVAWPEEAESRLIKRLAYL